MNAEALPAGQLACLLYDAAEGICADVAAVMLIDRHGHFLHDPAFRRIIAAGWSASSGTSMPIALATSRKHKNPLRRHSRAGTTGADSGDRAR